MSVYMRGLVLKTVMFDHSALGISLQHLQFNQAALV